jgi:hypothetical protein
MSNFCLRHRLQSQLFLFLKKGEVALHSIVRDDTVTPAGSCPSDEGAGFAAIVLRVLPTFCLPRVKCTRFSDHAEE